MCDGLDWLVGWLVVAGALVGIIYYFLFFILAFRKAPWPYARNCHAVTGM